MIKIRNQTLDGDNVELVKFEEDVTVGEYFETIKERLKTDKIACKVITKCQYDGMANFIFFYKFGKMYLHHSTSRDDFELEDIKDMLVYCVHIRKMLPEQFYIDDNISNKEEDKTLTLTYSELEILMIFIEESNDTLRYENKILQQIYDKLMKIYNKCESIIIQDVEIELSIKLDLEIQQYISLNLYLKQQIVDIHCTRSTEIYWDRINNIRRLELINNKIERICGKKTINSYPLYTIKDLD